MEVTLGNAAKSVVKTNTVKTMYHYPMSKHTILDLLGSANAQGAGFYVLKKGWDVWSASYPTMAYGTFANGGYCYWSSHPFDKNYFENGEYAKKLTEFQINWILSNATPTRQSSRADASASTQTMQEILDGSTGGLNYGLNGNYEYKGGRGVFTVDKLAGKGASSSTLTVDDYVHPHAVEIRKIGDDLLICMNGLSQRVDFPGWYAGGSRIQALIFADGTEWSAAEIESRAVESEPLRNLTLVQIENEIVGTEASDKLTGTSMNDVFIPGQGDDTMTGAGGCDVYYYEPNGGNDIIVNAGSTGIGGMLRFHEDIASADVKVSRQGGDVLLALPGGSVLVKDWYTDATARLGREEFLGDMTIFDAYDIELLASGNDLVSRDEYFDTSVTVKQFDEYKITGEEGTSGSSGGCNAGFAALALMGFAASVMFMRDRKTR